MSRIVIVGGGDFGRELHDWLIDDDQSLSQEAIWFVDEDPNVFRKHQRLVPQYLGPVSHYKPQSGDRVFMGVSNPMTKRSLASALNKRIDGFETFVHRTAILSTSCSIGVGTVVCPNVVISCDAEIGRLTTINISASIGHDAHIGDFSSLMSHVDITGWAHIGEASFVGSHASVLPHVVVEPESTVGAGSVAIRRVKQGSTVVGVPARPLGSK